MTRPEESKVKQTGLLNRIQIKKLSEKLSRPLNLANSSSYKLERYLEDIRSTSSRQNDLDDSICDLSQQHTEILDQQYRHNSINGRLGSVPVPSIVPASSAV